MQSFEGGLDVNERAFKEGGRQGQEPEGVKEYGKSQSSEWPGAAPLGVAMEKWPEGEWEPSQLPLCLPLSPARVDSPLILPPQVGPLKSCPSVALSPCVRHPAEIIITSYGYHF